MNEIAYNIRAARKESGMSQNALADKLSVTRQAVSSWETGKAYPDIEMLKSIAAALNTDAVKLIYGNGLNVGKRRFVSYKPVFIALIAFWVLLTFGGAWIGYPIFSFIMGGDMYASYLYPVYFGIMLLAGLIVGCTLFITERIYNIEREKREYESGDES